MITYASSWDIVGRSICQFVGFPVSAAGAGAGVAGAAGAVALPPRILNITVPQVGHLPLIALRPFFMTSSTASTISFLALHFTQYPSRIEISQRRRLMRLGSYYQ